MKQVLEGMMSGGIGLLFMVGNFPGGTILMAVSCRSNRLDGWDWVLSVIIPFYGFFKSDLRPQTSSIIW